jgi:methionyl-tRNA formyltransferase
MKLVFFGTSEFAVPALRAIAKHCCLVVTQPDRPTGRGLKLKPSPVKEAALELGLPVESPEKSRTPEYVERLRSLNPDAFIVAAYGQILSQAMLDVPRIGGINLHGSILPQYRGAAPIQRAIMNGDKETGITLMQMDKGMDTGDIIKIAKTPIEPNETYGELQERLSHLAAKLLVENLEELLSGNYPRTPQDPEKATHAAKIDRNTDAQIVITNPAQQEYNRFRAVTPNPGAFLLTKLGRLRIWEAELSQNEGEPGTWIGPQTVALANGSLELKQVQPEGKKRMSGKDFANGARLKIGDALVEGTE